MSDKQTTSLVLLFILAFVFYLYNSKSADGKTSKLKAIVDQITNAPGTDVPKPTATSDSYIPGGDWHPTSIPNVHAIPASITINPYDAEYAVDNSGMHTPGTLNAGVSTSGMSLDFQPPAYIATAYDSAIARLFSNSGFGSAV